MYDMSVVHKSSSKAHFTVISTFAGLGGSSTGYRLAGGQVLAINEFVDHACACYSANYPDTHIIKGDIRDVSGDDMLDAAGVSFGNLDMLDGSPPCASFSTSGSREKGWGKKKSYSGKTQRVDDLFFEYARLIRQIMPRVFIAENVKGLSTGECKKLIGSHRGFKRFQNDGTILGAIPDDYIVRYAVLRAADYGIPQLRDRFFFVGIRKDLNRKHPGFPIPVGRKQTVRMAYENLPNTQDEESDWLHEECKDCAWQKLIKEWPKNQRSYFKDEQSKAFNLLRQGWDAPSPTVTQAGQQIGQRGVIHPALNRKLTISELKRIMAFPDDFYLEGDMFNKSDFNKQAERLCRAVPPLFMKALAQHVTERVLG